MKKLSIVLAGAAVVCLIFAFSASASSIYLYTVSVYKGAGLQYSPVAQKLDAVNEADFGVTPYETSKNWREGTDWLYFRLHAYNGPPISDVLKSIYPEPEVIAYNDHQAYPRLVQLSSEYSANDPYYGATVSVFVSP